MEDKQFEIKEVMRQVLGSITKISIKIKILN
jgi:hypothetical protein